MTIEAVEAMDDEKFAAALAHARWLEDREVLKIEQGLLRALTTAFGRRR